MIFFITVPIVLFIIYPVSCEREISLILNERLDVFQLKPGFHENFVAHTTFKNAINSTGFSFLELKTQEKFDDVIQAYAAGFVEGIVSKELIDMHWYNVMSDYCQKYNEDYCKKLKKYINDNFKWMNEQISKYGDTDPFWHHVHLTLLQQQGLVDASKYFIRQPSSLHNFTIIPDLKGLFLFMLLGDLPDLEFVLGNQGTKANSKFQHRPSCSAIVKVTPNNEDLLVSQNTWVTYSSMLRVLKKYSLSYHTVPNGESIPGNIMSFSSYPGMIFSFDDFYMISSGLAAQETTLMNFDMELWKNVKAQSVFESIRNSVANRLAKSGKEWARYFAKHNSGTYNNQWMIVDYKKFTPFSPTLSDGLLTVAEQMPGLVLAADVTDVLRKQSYWGSYNIPYFSEIYKKAKYQSQVNQYGNWFSYDKTPRALIFRRDHHKVVDIYSLGTLMRYNDYKHDSYAVCNCTPPYSAENGIAARSDLNNANGTYPFKALGFKNHGGIDFKITSWDLSQKLKIYVVSGPTNDQNPTFEWSKSPFRNTAKHRGHPDKWDFKPFVHKWKYI